ncbi:MAG TPA: cobalamin-independent methionine synthase II family protein [Candidatus Binataceae bacterium]|jgi:5-methyltetrahydropteroyltriglutamate--homocysteine methyltransferase|nr:cobalamin-independent methionine synthase II family protein [Candidatus Binataceae bacterium]
MSASLLPTTVVGSYPQPDWLVDRAKLKERPPARVRNTDLWRVPEPFLEEAQDDATLVAIRAMEQAGVDIISDGEMRRESYSNRFANALGGIDREKLGKGLNRRGGPDIVPLVSGPIRRLEPVEVRDLTFLRANTDRRIKITLPGPFTMTRQAENAAYPDDESLAMAFAEAVNLEVKDLFAAGADVVQLDEPYMDSFPDEARKYAVKAINRALEGVGGTTVVHVCFGYGHYLKKKNKPYSFLAELNDCAADQVSLEAAQPQLDLSVLRDLPSKTIMLGVLNLGDETVETPEIVAQRIRAALEIVPPERLVVAPDCGMKYLSRAAAFGKLKAMVAGARIVRAEIHSA